MSTTIELLEARIVELEKQLGVVNAKKDEDDVKIKKKKRGVSGYLVFAKEMRETAKEEVAMWLPSYATPKPREVLTQVAKMWRDLSDGEKKPWNDKAKEENAGREE